MTGPEQPNDAHLYTVLRREPRSLTADELRSVIELLRKGAAVSPESAAAEIPIAISLVLAMRNNEIVGVGTIKRARPQYAASIHRKSKTTFPDDLPELGYVAVSKEHWRNQLSRRIVAELLRDSHEDLFATTDDDRMKRTLGRFGFVERGKSWRGNRSVLTLWLLSASTVDGDARSE